MEMIRTVSGSRALVHCHVLFSYYLHPVNLSSCSWRQDKELVCFHVAPPANICALKAVTCPAIKNKLRRKFFAELKFRFSCLDVSLFVWVALRPTGGN